jgi:hypothetical protein
VRLPPFYRPGEPQDEDGPHEGLPEWDTGTDKEKQQAFLQWAVEALDMIDTPRLKDELKKMESDYNIRLLVKHFDKPVFDNLKRNELPHLTWKAFCKARYGWNPSKIPERRGRKGDPKIADAIADWSRLTLLFRINFNRWKRLSPPSRIDILKARYQLSEAQCLTVEAKCTKAK